MTETLSSSMTFFYKYIFSIIWIGAFGAGTVSAFVNDGPSDDKPLFLGALIIGAAMIFATGARFKKVELNGTKLIVSNYFSSQEYDASEIVKVNGSIMFNPEMVWFTVESRKTGHRTVLYMPPYRLSLRFTRHPHVFELRELAQKARVKAGLPPL